MSIPVDGYDLQAAFDAFVGDLVAYAKETLMYTLHRDPDGYEYTDIRLGNLILEGYGERYWEVSDCDVEKIPVPSYRIPVTDLGELDGAMLGVEEPLLSAVFDAALTRLVSEGFKAVREGYYNIFIIVPQPETGKAPSPLPHLRAA